MKNFNPKIPRIPGGTILDYLENLTPTKEYGKYICPVCSGHNLSINQNTGEYDCYNCGDTKGIWKAIAPPLVTSEAGDCPRPRPKPKKSAKEKNRETQVNATLVETKVDELALLVAEQIQTPEQARVELSEWCKQWERDRFAASKLFEAKLAEINNTKVTLSQARQQLERLVTEGVEDSDIEIAIAQLAKDSGESPQTLNRIYRALVKQSEGTATVASVPSDLVELRLIESQQLPIEAGLYGDGGMFAAKIRQVADAMPTAPEFLVTTLIPVLATAIATSQTLVIHRTAGYTARPIFRTINVAKTGRKKTPSQNAILKALYKLESSAAADYNYQLSEHGQDYRDWAKNKDGPEPKPPTRTRYVCQDTTLAAKVKIHSENPRGLLLYKDEASAFITERGRFSSGKGDGGELEADLVEFNGGVLQCDRKADGNLYLERTGINRVGATQYSKLQTLMGNHNDDCGEFSRYLFCAAGSPPSKINLSSDVGDIDLTSEIMRLFTILSELPERDYLMSSAAKTAFQRYQHELTDHLIATDHPALEAAFPKFETYFGRFILWLHLVNSALAEQSPEPTVSAQTVELARRWTEYFIGQFKKILAINSPQQEPTGDALRVYEYLKRKGQPLKPSDISRGRLFHRDGDKSKRRVPYIRKLLAALTEQNWTQTDGDDLYFVSLSESPPNNRLEQKVEQPLRIEQEVDQKLSIVKQPKAHIDQGFSRVDRQGVDQVEQVLFDAQLPPPPDISEAELAELTGGTCHDL